MPSSCTLAAIELARRGVFSTRSQDRPNPIGLHTVKIVAIHDTRIRVSNFEALDRTPVVDIKPVLGPVRGAITTPRLTF